MKKKKTENPAENNAAESKSRVEAITEPAESVDTAEESDLSKVVFKKAFQAVGQHHADDLRDGHLGKAFGNGAAAKIGQQIAAPDPGHAV